MRVAVGKIGTSETLMRISIFMDRAFRVCLSNNREQLKV
jgi:hypothetical protein